MRTLARTDENLLIRAVEENRIEAFFAPPVFVVHYAFSCGRGYILKLVRALTRGGMHPYEIYPEFREETRRTGRATIFVPSNLDAFRHDPIPVLPLIITEGWLQSWLDMKAEELELGG